MAIPDSDLGLSVEPHRAALASDIERATRISRWSAPALYGVASLILGATLVVDGFPSVLELMLWLHVLLIVCLLPIEAAVMLAVAHRLGVQIRRLFFPPFAVVVDPDGHRRLRFNLRWMVESRHIFPTESTVDQYIAGEHRIMLAGAIGELLKAVLLTMVAVTVIVWTSTSAFIAGLFGVAVIVTLMTAISKIRAMVKGRAYLLEIPEFQKASESVRRANTAMANGKRPREVDSSLVTPMLASQPGTPIHVAGLTTAAIMLLDRGEAEAADDLVQQALAATNRGYGYLHYNVLLEAAAFAASVRQDPVTARALLRQASSMSVDRYFPILIEASALRHEGRMAEARQKALSGLQLIPDALYIGRARMDQEHLQDIIAAADQHLADAFAQEVIRRRDLVNQGVDPTD